MTVKFIFLLSGLARKFHQTAQNITAFFQNWGEPMGAPAIFEKQIEIKLLHSASTLESRIQAIASALR
ncbi:MAG: hypothetical protein P8X79_20240 [Reinekea sp.]